MPKESPARQTTAAPVDASSTGLRSDLWAMLDEVRSKSDPLDMWLGPLAGLLIAKWAAHEESKREAAAATDNRAFDPELPKALRLSAWDEPMSDHSSAVAEALRGMIAVDGTGNGAARHVVPAVPLVVRAVENSPSMFKGLLAWVRQDRARDAPGPGARRATVRRRVARLCRQGGKAPRRVRHAWARR